MLIIFSVTKLGGACDVVNLLGLLNGNANGN